jgi:hypothetical protein
MRRTTEYNIAQAVAQISVQFTIKHQKEEEETKTSGSTQSAKLSYYSICGQTYNRNLRWCGPNCSCQPSTRDKRFMYFVNTISRFGTNIRPQRDSTAFKDESGISKFSAPVSLNSIMSFNPVKAALSFAIDIISSEISVVNM